MKISHTTWCSKNPSAASIEPKFLFRIRPLWRPTLFLPEIGWESPILAEVYFYCSPQGLDDQRLLMLKKRMGKGQSERTKVKAHFLLHPPSCWRLAGLHSKPPFLLSTLPIRICRCVCQAHTTKLLWIEFPVQSRGRLVPELYPHLHELWRCPVMDDGFDLIHEKIEDHHSYIEREWIFGGPLPTTTQC